MEFGYDGGGPDKGGTVSLYLDGKKIGEGRVDSTAPTMYSLDETTDVGADKGSPVTPDYPVMGNGFTGQVNWVQIDIHKAAADKDHLISMEERFKVAMARQ